MSVVCTNPFLFRTLTRRLSSWISKSWGRTTPASTRTSWRPSPENQVWHDSYMYVQLFLSAFRIHLILTRIRILGSTFGKSGCGFGSSDPPFRNSGSRSSDPHLEKVDPDPVPKWIRIRVPIFHIFHKEIHVGQIKMLIFITAKI